MTKQQFMSDWRIARPQGLRLAYAGDPHGRACIAMALIDLEPEGERLWRKHRSTLKNITLADWQAGRVASDAQPILGKLREPPAASTAEAQQMAKGE